MILNISDISTHVTATLLQIREGLIAARNAGLIAELPEEVQFDINVVIPNGLNAVTRKSVSVAGEEVTTTTEPETTQRTTKAPSTSVSTRDPVTSTRNSSGSSEDKSSQNSAQSNKGGDVQTATNYQ